MDRTNRIAVGNSAAGGGIVQVIGVSGVGKTAVAGGAAKRLGLPLIDFADLILQSAETFGIDAKSHDDILDFPTSVLDRCVERARENLLEASRGRLVVLETHLAPRTAVIGYTFTSPDTLRERNTLGIALVADHLGGLAKKRKDRSARRDEREYSLPQVECDQLINIVSAACCCVVLDLPFLIIWNEYGKLEQSVGALAGFVIDASKRRNI